MKITIDSDNLEHIKEKSVYNNNYYTCGNTGYEILEKFCESYNFYEYYIVKGESEIFLGSSEDKGYAELLFQIS